jgi:prophage regulatory protein
MPPRATKKREHPIVLPTDDEALIRLSTVLAVFPIGETTWWNGIKAGRYPRPIRISTRVNAWTVGSIRKLLASVAE